MQIHTTIQKILTRRSRFERYYSGGTQEQLDGYKVKEDILYKYVKGDELFIVPDVQGGIILNAHNIGSKRIQDLIEIDYFICKLKEKVDAIISNCIQCIVANKKSGKEKF